MKRREFFAKLLGFGAVAAVAPLISETKLTTGIPVKVDFHVPSESLVDFFDRNQTIIVKMLNENMRPSFGIAKGAKSAALLP